MPVELPASVTPQEAIDRIFTPLSNKEKVFVQELCLRGSKFSAARVAGLSEDGQYSSAAEAASRLLAEPRIQLAIKEWQAVQRHEYQFLRDMLIGSLIEDAFFNPKDAYQSDGSPKPVPEMPDHVAERLTAYKSQKYGITLEFVDRSKAKTQLLQLLGVGQQSQGMTININLGDNAQSSAVNVTPTRQAGRLTLDITPPEE
jgi:phage terminase small subunit